MKISRENILKNGICFLFLILPIIVFSSFAMGYVSVKTFLFYSVTELLFVFWVYSLIVDKNYFFNKTQLILFIFPVTYVIWMTISGILAVNPHLAFWSSLGRGTGLLTIYHSLIISFIISSVINKEGSQYINKLLKYFILGSFLLVITVWLGNEGFNLPLKLFIKSSGGGFMGNSSLAAAYLLFSIFFSVYLLFSKNISNKWKTFIYLNLGLIIFSPLFINIYGALSGHNILGSARGAILGLIIGLGFSFLFYLIISDKRYLRIFGFIGILISIVIFYIGWNSLMKPDTFLHNKFMQVASGTRFLFWDISKISIKQHPYFGYGPENYMIAFQKNFNPKILTREYGLEAWNDRAHNIYFDTGVSGGYPAIILYFIFLLSICYAIYKTHKNGIISKFQASSLFGLLIAYLFQNLFVFDSTLSILALFLLVGVIYSMNTTDTLRKNNKIIVSEAVSSISIFLLSIIFITSFIIFSIMPLMKARNFTKVMTMPTTERTKHYNDLLNGSKVGDDFDASYFSYFVYTSYKKNLKGIKDDPQKKINVSKDISSNLDYLNKLMERNKNDYRLYLSALYLYNLRINLGDKFNEQEIQNFNFIAEHSHSLVPNDPQVYWNTGLFKLWQRDIQGSFDDYNKAIEIDKTNVNSWAMLLNFAKTIKSQELYDLAIKEAQKNIPGFNVE